MFGNDQFTVSLLHLDGTNGATTFPDVSAGAAARTWTASGSAQVSTAQSVFGGASLSLPSSSFITTPDSADFAFGTGDFTFDFWLRRAAISGARENTFGQGNSGLTGGYHVGNLTAANLFTFGMNDETKNVTTTTAIADTNWHHIAIVRNGNNLKIALGGTFEATTDITGVTYTDSPGAFAIGQLGAFTASFFNGFIDEFRISKGIARWTSNFTPPNEPYDAPAFPNMIDLVANNYLVAGYSRTVAVPYW